MTGPLSAKEWDMAFFTHAGICRRCRETLNPCKIGVQMLENSIAAERDRNSAGSPVKSPDEAPRRPEPMIANK